MTQRLKNSQSQRDQPSPESQISPYEDINMQQEHISEESFPNIILGICDKCLWCYTCINSKKIIKECPICKTQVSQVPMTIEEVCSLKIARTEDGRLISVIGYRCGNLRKN